VTSPQKAQAIRDSKLEDQLPRSVSDPLKLDERQGKIVELRFFGGLTVEQTAELLGISSKTVKRDWSMAKAWLHGEMKAIHGNAAGQLGGSEGAV
jgi:RNA polymerase sigma factor (sigma-70 family)